MNTNIMLSAMDDNINPLIDFRKPLKSTTFDCKVLQLMQRKPPLKDKTRLYLRLRLDKSLGHNGILYLSGMYPLEKGCPEYIIGGYFQLFQDDILLYWFDTCNPLLKDIISPELYGKFFIIDPDTLEIRLIQDQIRAKEYLEKLRSNK